MLVLDVPDLTGFKVQGLFRIIYSLVEAIRSLFNSQGEIKSFIFIIVEYKHFTT